MPLATSPLLGDLPGCENKWKLPTGGPELYALLVGILRNTGVGGVLGPCWMVRGDGTPSQAAVTAPGCAGAQLRCG